MFEDCYEKAEIILRRATQGRENLLGCDHKTTFESAQLLGRALYHHIWYTEAEMTMRRALVWMEKRRALGLIRKRRDTTYWG